MPQWLLAGRRNAWRSGLIAVCCLMLVLAVRNLSLIYMLRTPTPSFDIWGFFRTYAIQNESLDLSFYFHQHNDHRIATSLPFFLLDIRLTDGSGYFCNVIQLILMATIAMMMAMVFGPGLSDRLVVVSALFAVLSSPVQWQNLSAPFQLSFGFVNLFFIVAAFATLSASRARGPAFWGLLLTATVSDGLSVFSLASGVLDGVVIAAATAVFAPRSWAWRILLAAHVLWCAGFFWHYTFASDALSTRDLAVIVPFSLIYLGSCLRGLDGFPALLGAMDLVALCAATALAFRRKTDIALWLALTIAAAMTVGAAFTAFGRGGLGLGIYSAAASRYTIQSVMMQFALAGFYYRYFAIDVVRVPIVVLLSSLALVTTFDKVSLDEWRDNIDRVDQAQAAIVKGSSSDDTLLLLFPAPSFIKAPLAFMASHRLGPFSPRFGNLVAPPDFAFDVAAASKSQDVCKGAIEVKMHDDGQFFASGWIYSPEHPTDRGSVAVIDRNSGQIVASGPQTVVRPDVVDALPDAPLRSGFVVGAYHPLPSRGDAMQLRVVLLPAASDGLSCSIDANPVPERDRPN